MKIIVQKYIALQSRLFFKYKLVLNCKFVSFTLSWLGSIIDSKIIPPSLLVV